MYRPLMKPCLKYKKVTGWKLKIFLEEIAGTAHHYTKLMATLSGISVESQMEQ